MHVITSILNIVVGSLFVGWAIYYTLSKDKEGKEDKKFRIILLGITIIILKVL